MSSFFIIILFVMVICGQWFLMLLQEDCDLLTAWMDDCIFGKNIFKNIVLLYLFIFVEV